MPFECFSYGLSFDTVKEVEEHRLAHEEQPKRDLICLRYGKSLPVDSSKANYTGDILCPGCRQTMKVVTQSGEVAFGAT